MYQKAHKIKVMSKSESGYVYILTNPSFKEDWVKIGKSSRPVDVRSKELDNTAVPLPFEIYATLKTVKYNEVERQLHRMIDRLTDLRIRQNREFFNVEPAKALELLRDCAMVLDDAEFYVSDNASDCPKKVRKEQHNNKGNTTITRHKTRENFKFSLINIAIGETVVFTPTNIEVKVADDDKVEFEGRLYKLSPFVGTFMPIEKRNSSGAYQGAKYFTYKGEVLDDIRKRLESGDFEKE